MRGLPACGVSGETCGFNVAALPVILTAALHHEHRKKCLYPFAGVHTLHHLVFCVLIVLERLFVFGLVNLHV